jgi:DNA-binding response OmpR family regulator
MNAADRIAELEEEVRQLRALLCPAVVYRGVAGPRQTRALSTLHAARGRPVSFDKMAAVAWPDAHPENVTVRMAIHHLRQRVGPRGVRIVTGDPLSWYVTPESLPVLDGMRL